MVVFRAITLVLRRSGQGPGWHTLKKGRMLLIACDTLKVIFVDMAQNTRSSQIDIIQPTPLSRLATLRRPEQKSVQDAADRILLHNLRFWRFYFTTHQVQPGMLVSHQPLLAALERRDAHEALATMREHILISRTLLNALF